jgi:hypothetical protein
MPSDLVLGDVYLPPLLAAALVALILSSLTTRFLDARGWDAWFSNGPLVFFSLVVIYTVILGSSLFPT